MAKPNRRNNISPRGAHKLLKAVLGIAVILLVLSVTVLLPVRRCVAVGETRYTSEQFAQAMEISTQKLNLLKLDKAQLARKVHEALPYARIVRISRRLPGTLRLTVEERRAAFAQKQDKQWWLLAEDGRLLGSQSEQPEGLLLLTGAALDKPAAGQQAKWKGAFTTPEDIAVLLRCLRESSLEPSITALHIATGTLPDAVYQDRIRIRFGTAATGLSAADETALKEKLRMAEEVIEKKDQQNPQQRGILDLSTYGKAYFTADWS